MQSIDREEKAGTAQAEIAQLKALLAELLAQPTVGDQDALWERLADAIDSLPLRRVA
jgi:hypothetical protein